jgi:AraC-like DNA-binding protein
MPDMASIEFQLSTYPPGRVMAPHVDGCRRLSIVLAGTVVEEHARDASAAGPGSVAVKSADCVHHNRFGPTGTVMLAVVLPDPLLEGLDLAARWRNWRWLHEGSPRRAALRLALAGMNHDGVAAVEALGELGDPMREAARPIRSSAPTRARLERIRARLHEDPGHELSIAQVARDVGIHPVTVGLHFRRAFGCSIRAYRQRLRAERAALELLAPRPSLTALALRHGFYDLSHLTRIFRREFGVPPGAFQRTFELRGAPLQSSKTTWTVAV